MKWKKHRMDGSRTGVTAVVGKEWETALGDCINGIYRSPSGRYFKGGCTPEVARCLIELQPRMAYLKEVIGTSVKEMRRGGVETEIANWTVDAMSKGVETITGERVDFGLYNMGGIRIDMPEGDVLLDDIISMFPFKNNLCLVKIKGEDLRAVLEYTAANPQAIYNAEMVVKDGKLVDALVGGLPIDDNRIYNVATIDFLLDGGDGIRVAKNAVDLNITGYRVQDWMVLYINSLTEKGEMISAEIEGRITVI